MPRSSQPAALESNDDFSPTAFFDMFGQSSVLRRVPRISSARASGGMSLLKSGPTLGTWFTVFTLLGFVFSKAIAGSKRYPL